MNIEKQFLDNIEALKYVKDEDLYCDLIKENILVKEQIKYLQNSYTDEIPKIVFDNKKFLYKYVYNGEIQIPTLFFNGSIIEDINNKDNYIFVYRTDLNYKKSRYCVIINLHICRLDKNFERLCKPRVLNVKTYINKSKDILLKQLKLADGNHAEDPRLFYLNNDLHICYGDGYHMYQGKINLEHLNIIESDILEHPFETQVEKNWTPIIKNNIIHYIYSYSPHLIIFKMYKDNPYKIDKIFNRNHNNNDIKEWELNYGKIRGGTPFIYLEDKKQYISIFHSSKTLLQNLRYSKIYFSGIIILNKEFNILQLSKKPLYIPSIINPLIPRLNNRIVVIFPSGLFLKDDILYITAGENDYNNIILTINIDKLNNFL